MVDEDRPFAGVRRVIDRDDLRVPRPVRPYPRAGGTTILFESPIARPWIPMSKPGTTPPLPIVTGRGAYSPCQANMNAFGYEALSFAMAAMLVSKTRPFSANVPT